MDYTFVQEILRELNVQLRSSLNPDDTLPYMSEYFTFGETQKVKCKLQNEGKGSANDELLEVVCRKPNSFVDLLVSMEENRNGILLGNVWKSIDSFLAKKGRRQDALVLRDDVAACKQQLQSGQVGARHNRGELEDEPRLENLTLRIEERGGSQTEILTPSCSTPRISTVRSNSSSAISFTASNVEQEENNFEETELNDLDMAVIEVLAKEIEKIHEDGKTYWEHVLKDLKLKYTMGEKKNISRSPDPGVTFLEWLGDKRVVVRQLKEAFYKNTMQQANQILFGDTGDAGLDESQGATGGVPAVSSQEISAAPPLKLETEGPDEEIRKLREEMKNLKEEEALLRKSQEVERLRKELKEQKKTVEKLRGDARPIQVIYQRPSGGDNTNQTHSLDIETSNRSRMNIAPFTSLQLMTADRTPTSQTSRSEENKNDDRQSLGAYGGSSDSSQQLNIRPTSTSEENMENKDAVEKVTNGFKNLSMLASPTTRKTFDNTRSTENADDSSTRDSVGNSELNSANGRGPSQSPVINTGAGNLPCTLNDPLESASPSYYGRNVPGESNESMMFSQGAEGSSLDPPSNEENYPTLKDRKAQVAVDSGRKETTFNPDVECQKLHKDSEHQSSILGHSIDSHGYQDIQGTAQPPDNTQVTSLQNILDTGQQQESYDPGSREPARTNTNNRDSEQPLETTSDLDNVEQLDTESFTQDNTNA